MDISQPTITEGPSVVDNQKDSSTLLPESTDSEVDKQTSPFFDDALKKSSSKRNNELLVVINRDKTEKKIEKTNLLIQNVQGNKGDVIEEKAISNSIIDDNQRLQSDKQMKREKEQITDEEKLRQIEEFKYSQQRDIQLESDVSAKKRKGFTLAVNSRGGFSSSKGTVNAPMNQESANISHSFSKNMLSMSLTSANQGILNSAPRNIVEMEHAQPVSFGIIVSKELFDDLSLETGIVYTYLYSKEKSSGMKFNSNASRNFHYLGVPLNVNYRLFSLNNFDVYASLGGMIEKDVYGESRYDDEVVNADINSSSSVTKVERISQKNPQLSVNAGIGVSYPIYNDLKLYGKVGGAYYFDAKNNYNTIYSDKQITLDLNVGIRYDF